MYTILHGRSLNIKISSPAVHDRRTRWYCPLTHQHPMPPSFNQSPHPADLKCPKASESTCMAWGKSQWPQTTNLFPKALRYKWEVHWNTIGSSTAGISPTLGLRGSKSTAIQLEAYFKTHSWRIGAFFWKVVVGGILMMVNKGRNAERTDAMLTFGYSYFCSFSLLGNLNGRFWFPRLICLLTVLLSYFVGVWVER